MQVQQKQQQPAELTIKVVRSFFLGRDRVAKVGEVLTVPRLFGLELVAGGKATKVDAPLPPAETSAGKGGK